MKAQGGIQHQQFWRKLRLIKKCQFCRHKIPNPQPNLARKYAPPKPAPPSFTIDWQLRYQSAVPQPTHSQPPNIRYLGLSDSICELKYLIHYYRYYPCEPMMTCCSELRRIVDQHQQRKKIIEYKQIKKIFKNENSKLNSNQKINSNLSTKIKSNSSERILEALTSSFHDPTPIYTPPHTDIFLESFAYEPTGGVGRSLEEIDQCYKFLLTEISERKKTNQKGFHRKKNKQKNGLTQKKGKKEQVVKIKKNRKCNSCENLFQEEFVATPSKMSIKGIGKHKRCIKRQICKTPEPISSMMTEDIVKQYISNLKVQINEEKKGLGKLRTEKKRGKLKERSPVSQYYEMGKQKKLFKGEMKKSHCGFHCEDKNLQ